MWDTRMKEETKDAIFTFATALIVLSIVVAGAIRVWPRLGWYKSLKSQIATREAEIARVERETTALEEKVRRFDTDKAFVEAVARQNRRVYPGELVFVFEK